MGTLFSLSTYPRPYFIDNPRIEQNIIKFWKQGNRGKVTKNQPAICYSVLPITFAVLFPCQPWSDLPTFLQLLLELLLFGARSRRTHHNHFYRSRSPVSMASTDCFSGSAISVNTPPCCSDRKQRSPASVTYCFYGSTIRLTTATIQQ